MNTADAALDTLSSINPAAAGAALQFAMAFASTGAALIGWALGERSLWRDVWRARRRRHG